MPNRIAWFAVAGVVLSAIIACGQTSKPKAATTTTAPTTLPNVALAERLSDFAQITARSTNPTTQVWTASACLLEGAVRLDPNQSRYHRFLVEAYLRAGDTKRAIEHLTEYRKLEPNDRGAQIQQIDLYVSQMQTAEQKIKYLRDLMDVKELADEVRAHAAVSCAEILAQRGEDETAGLVLQQGLLLNPLNIHGLQLRYRQLAQGTPAERTSGLLALLRASPAQPATLGALIREIADVGLIPQALGWYELTLGVYPRLGKTPDPALVADYAAELYINNDAKLTQTVATQVTRYAPDNMEAWMLRLMAARAAKNDELFQIVQKQTTVAMSNRLAVIRNAAGDATATTRPVEATEDLKLPEPADELKRVQATGSGRLIEDFVGAATDIAWIRIYFDGKPADAAPWIDAIRAALGPDNLTAARLEGWAAQIAGKPADAKAKLAPIADRDPLAALGVVLMSIRDPAQQEKAIADGQKLLDQNASGIVGAILTDALRDRGLKVQPVEGSDDVKAELDKFPLDWMRIIDQPGTFYAARMQPARSVLNYSEPIFVEIEIGNNSNFDLTVGDDGVLHPDLWLDAQLRGAASQQFPGVAYDRLTQQVVLKAHTSASQTVRLDQGELERLLNANPGPSLHVSASIMTNPIAVGSQIGPGPAGIKSNMTGIVQRNGAPITSDQVRQKISDTLNKGDPADKLRTIDMLATYAEILATQKVTEEGKRVAQNCIDLVKRSTTDSDASVRGWAWYLTALLSGDVARPATLEKMIKDDAWQMRLLAMVVVNQSGQGLAVAKMLAQKDSDELVKTYARAVSVIPATSQPTTAPSPSTP